MIKIAAIVPAYNEESSIALVVNELNTVAKANNLQMDVVVVNDCSKDNTASIINQLNCVALHLPINLGIGGAVQTGFKYAHKNNYDFAIQIDGDGQHPAEEIPKLVAAQSQNNWDVAIGSRFVEKEGFQSTRLRRSGILYFRHLNKLLTGIDVLDSTSGFRMINKKTLELVCHYYPDEYPEPEAIVIYAKNNLTVGEVAVTMRERQGGKSSIGGTKSIYYMFKVSIAIIYTFIKTHKHGKNSNHSHSD